jgi:hypothetical protein
MCHMRRRIHVSYEEEDTCVIICCACVITCKNRQENITPLYSTPEIFFSCRIIFFALSPAAYVCVCACVCLCVFVCVRARACVRERECVCVRESVCTGSSREIENTLFDPASVFLSTHWRASNPASQHNF